MSWLDRLSVEENSKVAQKDALRSDEDHMSPGLTGDYDSGLREKAGMHIPPTLPEYMGLEGEYDPCGLAKRVALLLDQDPELDEVETLSIVQAGSTIRFQGHISHQRLLDRLVELTSHVDGTKAVDTAQVSLQEA